jgi:hypothetical protein
MLMGSDGSVIQAPGIDQRQTDGSEISGEVVGFLFQELRQAYSELADDDFKAMVLMALDEGVE